MRCILAVLVLVTSMGNVRAQVAEPDPAAFQSGLARVASLVKREKWKPALKEIKKLLADHEKHNYVRAKSAELEDYTRRCAFRITHPAPKPDDLIGGKLMRYVPRTGQIKIRYEKGRSRDWERNEGLLIHPARFLGPFTISIKGKRYPGTTSDSPYVIVGLVKKQQWGIYFGCPPYDKGNQKVWLPAKIIHVDDGTTEEVVSRETSLGRSGKPYRLKVKVGKSSIVASCNGKSFGQARKPKDVFGYVGFHAPTWAEVIISGQAEPSWIQGKMDQAHQKTMQEFAKSYKRSQHLPAWLFQSVRPAAATKREPRSPYPKDVRRSHGKALKKAERYLVTERYLEGLTYVRKLTDSDLPESTRSWFATLYLVPLGDHEGGLASITRSLELQPTFLEARITQARILSLMRRTEEASIAWESLIKDHPNEGDLYAEAASFLLLCGKPKQAKAIVEQALSRSIKTPEIDGLNRTLVKAIIGPHWGKVYEYRSPSYHVYSDIGRDTCKEAARILEEAFTAFNVNLKYIKKGRKQRFKVYLFSGQSGYAAYCRDLMGTAPSHTAGLYSPVLKQLLIWNLPDRKQMMRTVRHEGFHQYLDRFAHTPPTWFNEGMAEYYETARLVQGSLTGGQARPDHLEVLRENKLVPLEKFLYQDAATFYSRREKSYAQAWAMVHYLRHGDARSRSIFKRMMEVLPTALSRKQALDKVFEGVDFASLDRALRAYISGL